MSVSPPVHDILEAAATRLETVGWQEGGSCSFRVSGIKAGPRKRLCLLDTLGAEAWNYIANTESPIDQGALWGVVDELETTVIPALYQTILNQPGLSEETRRVLTFPSACPDISEAADPFFGAVAWYNDFACVGGEEAAAIIRKTAKEL